MNIKKKIAQVGISKIFTIIAICLALMFSFVLAGDFNKSNDSKNITTIINEDSIKEYNLIEKEITIKDIDRKSLVKIKLLTPLDNKVGLRYQRVAEYKLILLNHLNISFRNGIL